MTRAEFPKRVKVAAFERANGHCEECTAKLGPGNTEYDHLIPCALGGGNDLDNCVVLCQTCHLNKTTKSDVPRIAKAKRQRAGHIGAKRPARQSKFKRKVDGTVVLRATGEPVR